MPTESDAAVVEALKKLGEKLLDTLSAKIDERMSATVGQLSIQLAKIDEHLSAKIDEQLSIQSAKIDALSATVDDVKRLAATASLSLTELSDARCLPNTKPSETFAVGEVVFIDPPHTSFQWNLAPKGVLMVVTATWLVWQQVLRSLNDNSASTNVLVQGTPGVGKSCMLDVLTTWAVAERAAGAVVVVTARKVLVYVLNKASVRLLEGETQTISAKHMVDVMRGELATDEKVLVLHDIKQRLVYRVEMVQALREYFGRVVCLLASSPKFTNFKDFTNEIGGKCDLVVPPLTIGEAQAFVRQKGAEWFEHNGLLLNGGLNEEAFQEHWYGIVGGIPRHMESKQTVELTLRKMASAVSKVTLHPESSNNDEESSLIIALRSDESLQFAGCDFVSKHAASLWVARHAHLDFERLLSQLKHAGAATRACYGFYFERAVLQSIGDKQPLFCQEVLEDSSRGVLEKVQYGANLQLTEISTNNFNANPAHGCTTLFLPKFSNFAVADAIIVEQLGSGEFVATLIQATVKDSHPPSAEQFMGLRNKLKARGIDVKKMIWVVDPKSNLCGWQACTPAGDTGEEWRAVRQYVCRFGRDVDFTWVKAAGRSKSAALRIPVSREGGCDLTWVDAVKGAICQYLYPQGGVAVDLHCQHREGKGSKRSPLEYTTPDVGGGKKRGR